MNSGSIINGKVAGISFGQSNTVSLRDFLHGTYGLKPSSILQLEGVSNLLITQHNFTLNQKATPDEWANVSQDDTQLIDIWIDAASQVERMAESPLLQGNLWNRALPMLKFD